jgi:hypothetical protein
MCVSPSPTLHAKPGAHKKAAGSLPRLQKRRPWVLLLPTACLPSGKWITSRVRQWAAFKDQGQQQAHKVYDNNDHNQSFLTHEIALSFKSQPEVE